MNINIKFPNGDLFQVPAEVIAEQRTQYYAGVDGFEKGSEEWSQEFKQSMDPDEIYDWIQNNTDWKDVEPHAVKIESEKKSYDKMWFEAEFKIK